MLRKYLKKVDWSNRVLNIEKDRLPIGMMMSSRKTAKYVNPAQLTAKKPLL